jgi:hypothetical protein
VDADDRYFVLPHARGYCLFKPRENVVAGSLRLGCGETKVVVEADLLDLT